MDPLPRSPGVRLLVLGDSGVGKSALIRLLTAGPAAPEPGEADLDDEEHPEVKVYVGDAVLRGRAVPLEFVEPTDESFEGVAELHSQVDGVIMAYDAGRPETFQSLHGYWASGVIRALKAPEEPVLALHADEADDLDEDEARAVLKGIRRRVLSGFAQAKTVYDGVVREPRLVRTADETLLQAPVLFARCKARAVGSRPEAADELWEQEDTVAAARMDSDALAGEVDLVAFGAFVWNVLATKRRREMDLAPM